MSEFDWHLRGGPRRADRPFFSAPELAAVREWYAQAAQPETPLRPLRRLAADLGVADLLVKDETHRCGLRAFKIAGAQYAIARLVEADAHLGVIACATAGNHGLAVARAGRRHGLEVQVYVPVGTPAAIIDAIRAEGAHVVATSWDYDQTVRIAASDAAENGWTIVSDTGWSGYDEIPRAIMAGYTRIMDECARQWSAPPDLIVVQAGVGSLAGAVAGWLMATPALSRSRLVVVEPSGAACVLASLRAQRRVTLSECGPTSLVYLRCAAVSTTAWPALHDRVDAAIAVPDEAAAAGVGRLAHPLPGDALIVTGPSGASGLGALEALSRLPQFAEARTALGLGTDSRVLVIATEGGTPAGSARDADSSGEVV